MGKGQDKNGLLIPQREGSWEVVSSLLKEKRGMVNKRVGWLGQHCLPAVRLGSCDGEDQGGEHKSEDVLASYAASQQERGREGLQTARETVSQLGSNTHLLHGELFVGRKG
jgi:hypothetical protein